MSNDLDVRRIGDTTVVGFAARRILDEAAIASAGLRLFELADEAGCRKLLLNFRGVDSISSVMLGRLIVLHRKMMAKGGSLSLCSVAPHILGVFETTRLDRVLGIEPEPEADDPDSEGPEDSTGGVPVRVRPPKPAGGGSVSLPLPRAETED